MIGQRENASGAHFAFTDRWGGVSAAPYEELNLGGAVGDDAAAVTANRGLAAKSLGLEPDRVVWMNQVHGAEVAVVDGSWGSGSGPDSRPGAESGAGPESCSGSDSGSVDIPAVDAIVTTRRGLALAVLTADCVPVLLADPVAGVAAAAHAGRPGMIAGVVPAAVRAMTELGADPARIVARTGPAVCGRCYEVPEAMRAEVAAVEPTAYAETSWGTPSVDVRAGVHAQLERLGVRDREQSPVCTLESRDHFSYRRDRATGRLAGYVWLD